MKKIKTSKILYIKLGEHGCFERECITETHTIRLDYREINHDNCLKGNWDNIFQYYLKKTTAGAAKRHIEQIKKFYES